MRFPQIARSGGKIVFSWADGASMTYVDPQDWEELRDVLRVTNDEQEIFRMIAAHIWLRQQGKTFRDLLTDAALRSSYAAANFDLVFS